MNGSADTNWGLPMQSTPCASPEGGCGLGNLNSRPSFITAMAGVPGSNSKILWGPASRNFGHQLPLGNLSRQLCSLACGAMRLCSGASCSASWWRVGVWHSTQVSSSCLYPWTALQPPLEAILPRPWPSWTLGDGPVTLALLSQWHPTAVLCAAQSRA